MGQLCPPATTTTTTTTTTSTSTTTTATTTTTTTTTTTSKPTATKTLDDHTEKILFTFAHEASNNQWEIVPSNNHNDDSENSLLRGLLPVPPSRSKPNLELRNTNISFKALNHRCGLRYKKLRNKFYCKNNIKTIFANSEIASVGISTTTTVRPPRYNLKRKSYQKEVAVRANVFKHKRSSQPSRWPWQVGIWRNDMLVCGGVIISRDYVLTAAHCKNAWEIPNEFVMTAGSTKRSFNEEWAHFQ